MARLVARFTPQNSCDLFLNNQVELRPAGAFKRKVKGKGKSWTDFKPPEGAKRQKPCDCQIQRVKERKGKREDDRHETNKPTRTPAVLCGEYKGQKGGLTGERLALALLPPLPSVGVVSARQGFATPLRAPDWLPLKNLKNLNLSLGKTWMLLSQWLIVYLQLTRRRWCASSFCQPVPILRPCSLLPISSRSPEKWRWCLTFEQTIKRLWTPAPIPLDQWLEYH